MAIKRLLLLLSGTDADQAAADTAFAAASRLVAHLDGLHVRGDFIDTMPFIESSLSESQIAREFAAARARQEAMEEQARKAFEHALQQFGATEGQGDAVPTSVTARWLSESGRVQDILGQRGRVYDLNVLSPFADYPGATAGEVVESALFATGRPILVAPREAASSIGKNILIGWNRSAQAARAAAFALPFLASAETVTVAYVQTGAKAGPGPEELCANLACHGIAAEAREIDPSSGSVASNLAATARDLDADLLVMGAYSHSRLREMVLGGVTHATLTNLEVPVLMAH